MDVDLVQFLILLAEAVSSYWFLFYKGYSKLLVAQHEQSNKNVMFYYIAQSKNDT